MAITVPKANAPNPYPSFLIHFQHFLIAEGVITLQKRKNRETYLRLRWLGCNWINETGSTKIERTASSTTKCLFEIDQRRLRWLNQQQNDAQKSRTASSTRPRIKKRESERRRFVNRNKKLTFCAVKQQWSRRLRSSALLCSSAHRLKIWNWCVLLIRFHCSSSFWNCSVVCN